MPLTNAYVTFKVQKMVMGCILSIDCSSCGLDQISGCISIGHLLLLTSDSHVRLDVLQSLRYAVLDEGGIPEGWGNAIFSDVLMLWSFVRINQAEVGQRELVHTQDDARNS